MSATPNTPSPTAPEGGGVRPYVLVALLVGLVAYAADQSTKLWVESTMELGERTDVVPGLLWWRYVLNPGAAFSIGENMTWVFTIVQAVVPLAILWFLRQVRSRLWAVALGLVMGGALGNLTDRLFRPPGFGVGHVVDFIAVPNFAVFNLADSAVVVGVGLVLLATLLGIGLDGVRQGKETDGAEDEGSRA